MFQSLPSSLTNSLNSLSFLQDSPKLSFRTSKDGIAKFIGKDLIDENDDEFWTKFYKLFDSTEDVYTLISQNDIRIGLNNNKLNIYTLIQKLTKKLRLVIYDKGVDKVNEVKECLNCCRVLSRVLPIIYESGYFNDIWDVSFIDNNSNNDQYLNEGDAFVIDDDGDDNNNEHNKNDDNKTAKLMDVLISSLIDCLFSIGVCMPDECIAPPQVNADDRIPISHLIWTRGVGSSNSLPSSPALQSNRSVVLSTILSAVSQCLYTQPDQIYTVIDITSKPFNSLPRKTTLTLLCSLLNTSLDINSKPSPARLLSPPSKEEQALPHLCMQLLLLLLNTDDGNFSKFFSKLHRNQDLNFIFDNVLNLINVNMANNNNTFIKSSIQTLAKPSSIPSLFECWLLLWRLVDLNKKVDNYFHESEYLYKIINNLVSTIADFKDKKEYSNLIRLLVSFLQTLSTYSAIKVVVDNPSSDNPNATMGDLIVNTVYSIVCTPALQANVYSSGLMSLTNMSPFIKHLSQISSIKLLSMYKAFSSPFFLLADDSNPRYLFWILEVFNGIIHNELNNNPNVIYGLLMNHDSLKSLATMTLSKALKEIESKNDVQQTNHNRRSIDQLSSTSNNNTSPTSSTALYGNNISATYPPPQPQKTVSSPVLGMSEKAKGKQAVKEHPHALKTNLNNPFVDIPSQVCGWKTTTSNDAQFEPKEDWVKSWVVNLPLDSILIMLTELLPVIRNESSKNNIIRELRSVNINNLIGDFDYKPQGFKWTKHWSIWRNVILWSQIYVCFISDHTCSYNGTKVKLFGVQSGPRNIKQQAFDSFNNVVNNTMNRMKYNNNNNV